MSKPTFKPADLVDLLFAAAVAQGRADALRASAVKAARELAADEVTQRCLESFKRQRQISQSYEKVTERTQAEIDAEMLGAFDFNEAQAINRGGF